MISQSKKQTQSNPISLQCFASVKKTCEKYEKKQKMLDANHYMM